MPKLFKMNFQAKDGGRRMRFSDGEGCDKASVLEATTV
jgi:hypothetical protein